MEGQHLQNRHFQKVRAGPRHVARHGPRRRPSSRPFRPRGPNKAVYGYPSEHYEFWRAELPGQQLDWGAFGENFTTEGLLENQVFIGDRYRVGSAVVMVQTPRLPCFKLAAKFQRDDIIRQFLRSGRTGFYFSVVEEGEVGAGDRFEFLGGEVPKLTIAEMLRLYASGSPDLESLQQAVQVKLLPAGWRERFQARISALHAATPIEVNPKVR